MSEPPLDSPGYRSTALRHPQQPLVGLDEQDADLTGPRFEQLRPGLIHSDLTSGGPIGERIKVFGRLLGADGEPINGSLIEVWQANAAGRYRHPRDVWNAPLDPGFTGAGRAISDVDGCYEFLTIKPGAYPWGNHANAWRPAHIHFAVLGRSFEQRLVTQMYFPGDPLLAFDPIFNAVRDEGARSRLVSDFSLEETEENWALAYRFDIVVAGRAATPVDGAQ